MSWPETQYSRMVAKPSPTEAELPLSTACMMRPHATSEPALTHATAMLSLSSSSELSTVRSSTRSLMICAMKSSTMPKAVYLVRGVG